MPDGHVAIVTDSTVSLPPGVLTAAPVHVVPLRLLAGDVVADDGDPDAMAALELALAGGARLTTARPSPGRFAECFARAAAAGASGVVCVHLSWQLSGTVSSAELAAREASVPVAVVDAQSIGTGLGLVVLAAARAAGAGLQVAEVAAVASRQASLTRSFFALDSAGPLLAGGRAWPRSAPGSGGTPAGGEGVRPGPSPGVLTWDYGPCQAVLTQPALVARPVLEISAGRILTLGRVRTWGQAAGWLAELAIGACGGPADLAVQHAGEPDRAASLAARLARALAPAGRAGQVYLAEAGLAIRAHTGEGMLAVSAAPHLDW
jgi:fatty acid-binding protein DegV